MTETVLVPIDGSEPADAALDFALERFPDAHLVVYHAINPLSTPRDVEPGPIREDYWSKHIEDAKADAEDMLEDAERRVGERDAEVELEAEIGPPTEAIVEYLDTREFDHVVIGSHGRTGLTRVFMGSVAEKVVRHSPAPVTIVHGDGAS